MCSHELSDYDFHLPHELIAQMPTANRVDARLMVVDRQTESIRHCHVYDFPQFLRAEDCLILNNTKVVPARLIGKRTLTNGNWEGLFLETDTNGFWKLMCKTRGKLVPGELINLHSPEGQGNVTLEMLAKQDDGNWLVRPVGETASTFEILDRVGWVPIPPYIRNGRMVSSDKEQYQTVYASQPGAVAAPTAGLHFSPELLQEIQSMGVDIVPVTLHVGAGTFRPVSTEKIDDHLMHYEWCEVNKETVAQVQQRKSRGGRIIAIGTTSVRTLESASALGQLQPFSGSTNLFIKPGYPFRTVDVLMTNFHLPLSTLLILVRTFGGDALIRRAYEEAIQKKYRFYSYGDAMLIL